MAAATTLSLVRHLWLPTVYCPCTAVVPSYTISLSLTSRLLTTFGARDSPNSLFSPPLDVTVGPRQLSNQTTIFLFCELFFIIEERKIPVILWSVSRPCSCRFQSVLSISGYLFILDSPSFRCYDGDSGGKRRALNSQAWIMLSIETPSRGSLSELYNLS